MTRSLLILLIASTTALADNVVLPVPPTDLISLLAPAPEGWKVVKSRAGNVFSGNLISIADRQFELVPPQAPDGSKPEKSVLTIQLTDTGKAPQRLAIFDPATAGQSLSTIAGFPAIKVPEPGGDKALILIKGRLLLSVQGRNAKPDVVDRYITQAVALIQKTQLPQQPVPDITKPLSYIEEIVDELNPKLSRKFKASAAIAVEVDPNAPRPVVNFQ